MTLKNAHMSISTAVNFMLIALMVLNLLTPPVHENYFHQFSYIYGVFSFLGLIIGSAIALSGLHFKNLNAAHVVSATILRYVLAFSIIPHFFYYFFHDIPFLSDLSLKSEWVDAHHMDQLKYGISAIAIACSLFLLIDGMKRLGMLILLGLFSLIVGVEYIIDAGYAYFNFSYLIAVIGLFVSTAEGSWEVTSQKLIKDKINIHFPLHTQYSIHALKAMMICGLMTFSYNEYVHMEVPDHQLVSKSLQGSWKKRYVSYYNVSLSKEGMKNYLEELEMIDSLILMNDSRGFMSTASKVSPISYNFIPSENGIKIYGTNKVDNLYMHGRLEMTPDGELKYSDINENITILFEKKKE